LKDIIANFTIISNKFPTIFTSFGKILDKVGKNFEPIFLHVERILKILQKYLTNI